jgi:hypothetical protein
MSTPEIKTSGQIEKFPEQNRLRNLFAEEVEKSISDSNKRVQHKVHLVELPGSRSR